MPDHLVGVALGRRRRHEGDAVVLLGAGCPALGDGGDVEGPGVARLLARGSRAGGVVAGALVSAGARAGKASVVTQTPRVATTAQRLTKRTVLSPIGP